MPFVVALLIWFVLSIPASLLLGRFLAGASERRTAPLPARRIPSSGHGLARR
jgi:hypothetical protein